MIKCEKAFIIGSRKPFPYKLGKDFTMKTLFGVKYSTMGSQRNRLWGCNSEGQYDHVFMNLKRIYTV